MRDPNIVSDYIKENAAVTIKIITGEIVCGNINKLGYDRVSDFISDDAKEFIVVYDAAINGRSSNNLLINKKNISYIQMTNMPRFDDYDSQ